MRLLALTRTNLKNYHLQKKGSFNHIIYIFGKATLGILRTGLEASPGEGYRIAGKDAEKSSTMIEECLGKSYEERLEIVGLTTL